MHLLRYACSFLLCATFAHAAPPQFSAPETIATGFTRLSDIAVADFNGDGKLDIATTDLYQQRIVVYLNTGNGTFAAPVSTTLQIPNGTGALLAGDFNEDGKQDLILSAVPGTPTTQVDLFLSGNGDGTFAQGTVIASSHAFADAVAVDFNRDGHLDFAEAANGMVNTYLGDGHGNFTMQTLTFNPPLANSYAAIVAADFNKDNLPDLAVTTLLDKLIYQFTNLGNGSFATGQPLKSSTVQTPVILAAADFNLDGSQDLLVGAGSSALIVFGNGDGTFQLSSSQITSIALPAPPVILPTIPPPLVAAADINGDGKVDAVVQDSYNKSINVFLNDGTGKFPQTSPDFSASIAASTNQIGVADLNGDGLPDIILSNYSANTISIFLSIRPQTNPIVTLSASANQQLIGTPLTLTAKATGLPIGSPTGVVTLLDGSNSLGQQTLNSSGQATFTLATLGAGQHSLSLSYGGDQYNSPAASTTLTQNVTDFQIALPSPSQTVTAGTTATYSLTLTPVSGLAGSVRFSCTGLPVGSTCTGTPLALNGQPATATITVPTSAAHAQVDPHATTLPTIASVSLASLLLTPFALRRRRLALRHLAAILLCLAILGVASGCSGGAANSNSGSTQTSTPVNTSFLITGSVTQGSTTVTHTAPATLIVQ